MGKYFLNLIIEVLSNQQTIFHTYLTTFKRYAMPIGLMKSRQSLRLLMKWKINTLEYTNDNDKGVVTAHWDVTLTDGDYTARRHGSAFFRPLPEGSDYTPFEDLTEEQVIGW